MSLQKDKRSAEQRAADDEVQREIEAGTFSTVTPDELRESLRRAAIRKESRRRAEELGILLGELRRLLGLTQAEVAASIRTKRPDISRLESGRQGGLTVERLFALLMTFQEAAGRPLRALYSRPASSPGLFGFTSVEETIAGGGK